MDKTLLMLFAVIGFGIALYIFMPLASVAGLAVIAGLVIYWAKATGGFLLMKPGGELLVQYIDRKKNVHFIEGTDAPGGFIKAPEVGRWHVEPNSEYLFKGNRMFFAVQGVRKTMTPELARTATVLKKAGFRDWAQIKNVEGAERLAKRVLDSPDFIELDEGDARQGNKRIRELQGPPQSAHQPLAGMDNPSVQDNEREPMVR